ncbi:uncharacterized protein LOC117675085 [Pantherophis guttatus]|uniref:ribonuclease H n=1 Tax=Pantherophis guttatus TaxID=94885 RepID=A0A6P9D0P1_PANGU|nr:uncharacterized protein LOC117675085 [Pantherophis guttatus]
MAPQRSSRANKQRLQGEESQGPAAVPTKRSRKTHHSTGSSKVPQSSAALAKEELKLHKAIEKAIQKATKTASLQDKDSLTSPQAPPLPRPTSPPPQATVPALSPDCEPSLAEEHVEVNTSLFGVQSEVHSNPNPAEASGAPDQPGTSSEQAAAPPEALITPILASYIREAIKEGVRQELLQRTSSWVSEQACSQVDVEGSLVSADQVTIQPKDSQTPGEVRAISSYQSDQGSLAGADLLDQEMSEDEDLAPDQPAFVGLFKPQLFRSLLHKAKITTGLGISRPSESNPKEGTSTAVPLFEEPSIETEEIPGPGLFKDVLQRQWSSPASGPSPSAVDRRLYNLAPDLSSLLQVPSVDQPIAELSSSSNIAGPPEDSLRPEDRRLENSLVRSHQATAWSVKSAMAASFFNRASILWLRQLQARLPISDIRSQQDISKVIVALEYSADATLNSSRFAAKAIGSSVAARRLLWLRHWQADSKSKWRLASSSFGGPKLFGAALEPLLVESKDKRRVLPNLSRRSNLGPTRPFGLFAPRRGASQVPVGNDPFSPPNPDPRIANFILPPGVSPGVPFEEAGGEGSADPADGLVGLPIGGRLASFASRWEATSSDVWVRRTVRYGLSLEFISTPPDRFLHCPISRVESSRLRMASAIHHLLEIRAIEPVPQGQRGLGYYSRLFVIRKSSGGWRAILDLKSLNRRIVYRRFKMQSLQTILEGIRVGDLLSSIDLTEAYLHVPILPSHRRFLRFCFANNHYQYRALPFGLSSAPRVFTKLMSVLAAHLRTLPIRMQFYLDDLLIQSTSVQAAHQDLATTLRVLREHGFSVNLAKSLLNPATRIQHLGAVIDSKESRVYLSQDRLSSLRSLVRSVTAGKGSSLASLSKLLGKMVSCIGIVPWAHLHCRHLQWFLLPYQKRQLGISPRVVRLPPKVLKSLQWWNSDALLRGREFREPQHLVLTTDASLHGWGAHLSSSFAQGRWTKSDLTHNINWLELRAIHLALRVFSHEVRNRHVLVRTDNVAAKAHVNRLGGTRSRHLMQEAERLGSWAEAHLRSLRALHISGVANTQADWLSRATVDPGEWALDPALFSEITLLFGTPVVDLFATRINRQVRRFFSRFPEPEVEGVDALHSDWPPGLLYAFPPLPLVAKVIRKMLQEKAELLLIAPHWPRRPWFADLRALSIHHPWRLPRDRLVLRQGSLLHPDAGWLQLTAWRLSGAC